MKKLPRKNMESVRGGGIDTVSGILGGALRKALLELGKSKTV